MLYMQLVMRAELNQLEAAGKTKREEQQSTASSSSAVGTKRKHASFWMPDVKDTKKTKMEKPVG